MVGVHGDRPELDRAGYGQSEEICDELSVSKVNNFGLTTPFTFACVLAFATAFSTATVAIAFPATFPATITAAPIACVPRCVRHPPPQNQIGKVMAYIPPP
jgi:hypothetical protein